MDSESASNDVEMETDDSNLTTSAQKIKLLSNGTNERDSPTVPPEGKSLSSSVENGMACNGMAAASDSDMSGEGGDVAAVDDSDVSGEGADVGDDRKDERVAQELGDTDMDDDDIGSKSEGQKSAPPSNGSDDVHKDKHDLKEDDVRDSKDEKESGEAPLGNCDGEENSGGAPRQRRFKSDKVIKRESSPVADISNKNTSSDEVKAADEKLTKPDDDESLKEDIATPTTIKIEEGVNQEEDTNSVSKASLSGGKDEENINKEEEVSADKDKEKVTNSKNLRSKNKKKKNIEVAAPSEAGEAAARMQKSGAAKQEKGLKENGKNSQPRALGGDLGIAGVSKPAARASGFKNAHLFDLSGSVAGVSGLNQTLSSTGQGLPMSTPMMHGLMPGFPAHGMSSGIGGFPLPMGSSGAHHGPNPQIHVPTVAPPKPKSSLDQIELIRWEIQNRINTRPKYFKPNPSSDLGPLAKFLFDIGSDLIKEAVYHDLVKIQSKKNGDNKLNAKEKEDLQKLKEIEKDLFATIGHLKLKLRQKCKVCNFQTESSNVMYFHKQYPHEDNKSLRCAHCQFTTKQAMAFKFHMEAEHGVQAKLHDKKAFYECDLCPYENNQEQKLVLHKQRCIKQFRPLFNLHPSCLSGAEINLCLENIFYKPVVPKNLKLLQQKHAQQQAALAEARRQQAQIQALAAQKNAAAVAAKKQQHLQKRLPAAPTPRTSAPSGGRMPAPPRMPATPRMPAAPRMPNTPRLPSPAVRYNASNAKPCPTVATMLNTKQNPTVTPSGAGVAASAPAAGGFEVCEICGGYVKDRKALRIHFFYAHRIDLPFNLFDRTHAPLYCATCYVRFWTAHGLRKHIDTHKEENQTRGVVGKCISCGHHVLNLLLHMRVVHNREMQHYITALMCMFCGNHFSSPQECEQHILKVHGHIDPLTGTLKSAPSGGAAPQPAPPKPGPTSKKPGNNNLVKGSVCVLCNLNFGRNVDLTRHCMRMHHTCMKCGMVVIDKASLMKHTCLSSPSGTRDCAMCGETGFHPAYYVKHLRDKHLQKFSIRVSKLGRNAIERWTKRPYPFKDTDVLEISDDDGDEGAEGQTSPKPAVSTAGKRPRIGPASKIGRAKINPEPVETPAPVEEKVDESLAEDASDCAKDDEVTKETADGDGSHDESSEPSPGQKRKRSESPGSDKDSKRKK